MKTRLYLILLVLIFDTTAFAVCLYAQNEIHWLPNQPGKWSYKHQLYGEIGDYKLTPGEVAGYRQKIETMVETFHQNPVLKNPVGFEPSVNVRIFDENTGFMRTPLTKPLTKLLVGGRIAILFCPYFQDKSGQVQKHCMEVTSCDIDFNYPKSTAESYLNYGADGYHEDLSAAADKLNRVFIKPRVVKELAEGVTAYSSGIIIVSGTARPPYWIPVTIDELFKLQLDYYELNYKLNKEEYVSEIINVIKNDRATYSPEQLKLPAYYNSSTIARITDNENENPYMQFNPEYFDRSLPRNDVQIIAVHTLTEVYNDNCNCSKYNNYEAQKHCEFVKQIDANALKALLDVK